MAGSGPTPLFVHDRGDDSSTWLGVLASLTRDCAVIAPDLLGHSGSDKPCAGYSAALGTCPAAGWPCSSPTSSRNGERLVLVQLRRRRMGASVAAPCRGAGRGRRPTADLDYIIGK
ncbi:hypothetical protein GCM10017786_54850 [Amycolatopsis deserti]|uniref:AB hydrolase-1 domain-containing protein n=1 Tax=Amycolatopsis deserti TaxID=185696 RepID=A0ABQ3JBV4_9PSEU|nr:hypothetical protein GCM10017786_54850 [Amycolatopsis deserti]